MSISSVIVSNNEFFVNYGGNGSPSLTKSYPIAKGYDDEKFVVFPDGVECSCFINDIEESFGEVNFVGHCFGGAWDEDNALSYDEVINYFINDAEIPVLIEKE